MNYTVSDIIITKGDQTLTLPGRTFDSSTAHDVAQYIDTQVKKALTDSEQTTADRVEAEQVTKLDDPVKAEGVDQ